MSTPAQFAANRANAQLSSGAKTPEGKATSSLNAVKTGLTGRTVLLPTEDAAAYTAHIARFEAEWQPATDAERALVQSLADTEWRLLRIPGLEAGIYALGRLEFAPQFQNHDDSIRTALIDAHIFRAYRRDLSNLSIQECRLRRQREKDTAQLEQLQAARTEREKRQLAESAQAARQVKRTVESSRPSGIGFEFSSRNTGPHAATPNRLSQASIDENERELLGSAA